MAHRDDIAASTLGMMRDALIGDDAWSWGHIDTYDPIKYTATAILEPSGQRTEMLEINVPALGLALDHAQGTRCLVALDHGRPFAIVGVGHADDYPADNGAILQSDVWISGKLRSDTLELAQYRELPDATSEWRGKMVYVSVQSDGEAGIADSLYICIQDASGVLGWTQLA